MESLEPIVAGSPAPDFILHDQENQEVRLSNLNGKKVLLSFHPLAWTGVCAEQMNSLEANFERFSASNAVAFGISIDSVPCKKAWAKSLAIDKTRLLADFWPHGQVAQAYGLFREISGFAYRANVWIDESGNAIWVKTYPLSQLPDIDEVLAVVQREA
jgi:peroxiredoxin